MVEVKHSCGATWKKPKLIPLKAHCHVLIAIRKTLVVQYRGSSPTWGQKRGTQAGHCPVSLGAPHPRRIRGVKEGFDREDPALERFPNLSNGGTCSTTPDTLQEFLPGIYMCITLLQFTPMHWCQARVWPQNCTQLFSSWARRKLLCILRTHLALVPSHKTHILILQMYLIQKLQWY